MNERQVSGAERGAPNGDNGVGSRRLLVFKFYRAVAWNRRFRMPVGGCAVIGGNVAL
ncbi:hypothetical protein [Brucella anthropi]|uniref:hypothetical protein n=1 Tax=Brucella anthropi TaxID=529 RepID=UPI00244BEB19|nr:hypothetical protein [Brucella anthropi]MDH0367888.1 hypothetical protein [Brucella anthropi]